MRRTDTTLGKNSAKTISNAKELRTFAENAKTYGQKARILSKKDGTFYVSTKAPSVWSRALNRRSVPTARGYKNLVRLIVDVKSTHPKWLEARTALLENINASAKSDKYTKGIVSRELLDISAMMILAEEHVAPPQTIKSNAQKKVRFDAAKDALSQIASIPKQPNLTKPDLTKPTQISRVESKSPGPLSAALSNNDGAAAFRLFGEMLVAEGGQSPENVAGITKSAKAFLSFGFLPLSEGAQHNVDDFALEIKRFMIVGMNTDQCLQVFAFLNETSFVSDLFASLPGTTTAVERPDSARTPPRLRLDGDLDQKSTIDSSDLGTTLAAIGKKLVCDDDARPDDCFNDIASAFFVSTQGSVAARESLLEDNGAAFKEQARALMGADLNDQEKDVLNLYMGTGGGFDAAFNLFKGKEPTTPTPEQTAPALKPTQVKRADYAKGQRPLPRAQRSRPEADKREAWKKDLSLRSGRAVLLSKITAPPSTPRSEGTDPRASTGSPRRQRAATVYREGTSEYQKIALRTQAAILNGALSQKNDASGVAIVLASKYCEPHLETSSGSLRAKDLAYAQKIAFGDGAEFKAELKTSLTTDLEGDEKARVETFASDAFLDETFRLVANYLLGSEELAETKTIAQPSGDGRPRVLHHLMIEGREYVPQAHLGTGGFGQVFSYSDAAGHTIAVKLPVDMSPKAKTMWAQEATLQTIATAPGPDGKRDPNVLGVEGLVRSATGDMLYIAMELTPNGSVEQAAENINQLLSSKSDVSAKTIDEDEATTLRLTLLSGMARGVAKVNETIVHNDVKGPNAFIDAQGNVKLADYGTGKLGTTAGYEDVDNIDNAHWQSPEILYLKREIDGKQRAVIRATKEASGVIKAAGENLAGQVYKYETARVEFEEKSKIKTLNSELDDLKSQGSLSEKTDVWSLLISGLDMFEVANLKTKFPYEERDHIEKYYNKPDVAAIAVKEDLDEAGLFKSGALARSTGDHELDAFFNHGLQADAAKRPTAHEVADAEIFKRPGVGSQEARDLIVAIQGLSPVLKTLREAEARHSEAIDTHAQREQAYNAALSANESPNKSPNKSPRKRGADPMKEQFAAVGKAQAEIQSAGIALTEVRGLLEEKLASLEAPRAALRKLLDA